MAMLAILWFNFYGFIYQTGLHYMSKVKIWLSPLPIDFKLIKREIILGRLEIIKWSLLKSMYRLEIGTNLSNFPLVMKK